MIELRRQAGKVIGYEKADTHYAPVIEGQELPRYWIPKFELEKDLIEYVDQMVQKDNFWLEAEEIKALLKEKQQ